MLTQPISAKGKNLAMWLWIAIIVTLIPAISVASVNSESQKFDVLESNGEVYLEQNNTWEKLKEGEFLQADSRFRIGPELNPDQIQGPITLSQAYLVVAYSENELITISNGTSIRRQLSSKEKNPEYQIDGVGHIIINHVESAYSVKINGLRFQTKGVNIFFTSLQGYDSYMIVEGEALVDVINEDESTHQEPIQAGSRVLLSDNGFKIEKQADYQSDATYTQSLIPGFSKLGAYKRIGVIKTKGKETTVTRYGETFSIRAEITAMMEGDIVRTANHSPALLRLASKDDFRVYPNSDFTVSTFNRKERKFDLKTSGRIRARISKRRSPGKIRFRTATAMVSVKGTDLQLISSASNTSVSTVEGVVGLADAAGNGEIDILNGMRSSVASDGLPTPPEAIPADDLQALYDEGLPVNADDVVLLQSIAVSSPQNNMTYSHVLLRYQADPGDATLQFQIDGKVALLGNGSELGYLPNGEHELLIKGFGESDVSERIIFTIDKTAPAIVEDPTAKKQISEGSPLVLTWTKPLSNISARYKETVLPASISPDENNRIEIDTTPLFKSPPPKLLTLELAAVDEIGNESVISQVFHVLTTPPALTLAAGGTLESVNVADDVKIVSDQAIAKWRLTIDGAPINLPVERVEIQSEDPVKSGVQTFKITKEILSRFAPGIHQVRIEAKNSYGSVGIMEGAMLFDFAGPEIVSLSRAVDLKNLIMKKDETLTITWSKPLTRVSAEFQGQPWQLSPGDNQMILPVIPPEDALAEKPVSYKITVFDRYGRPAVIQGVISEEVIVLSDSERGERLKKAYKASILLGTNPEDQILKTFRPGFIFDTAKPEFFLNSNNGEKGAGAGHSQRLSPFMNQDDTVSISSETGDIIIDAY